MDVIRLLLFHLHTLELPDTLLLSTSNLRVRFLHNNNVWKTVLMAVVVVLKFLNSHLVEVVAEHSVIKINEFSQMSVDKESPVSVAKL